MFRKTKTKTKISSMDTRKLLNQLEINIKKTVQTKLIGRYKSIFRGTGLEFDSFRDYTPEDDYFKIDWKISQRANKLLVRQYIEERKIKVYFIVNTSNSMLFGSSVKLKNEYAADIISLLAYVSVASNDMVGFAFFNEEITKFVKPLTGDKQFFILLNELTNGKNYGGGCKFKETLDYLFHLIEERSVVIVVSDFIGVSKDIDKIAKLYGKKFDTIFIMVRDKRDETLACDIKQIVLQDPYSNKTLLVDPNLINKRYEAYVKKEEENLKDLLTKSDIDFVKINTDKPFLPLVMGLFKKRELQRKEILA